MPGRQRWAAMARICVVAVLIAAAAGCAKAAPSGQAVSTPPGVASASGTPDASGSPGAGAESATPGGGGSRAGTPDSTASSPGAAASGSATPSGSSVPSASIAPGAKNLALTPELTHEILIAAATFNKLPVTAYTGLEPHSTYAGRDSTGTVWAAAALQPSPSSVPAQVSVQDDGSYLLLRRNPSGDWTVWSVGLASAADCAKFGLPAALRTLWGWPSTGCHPHP